MKPDFRPMASALAVLATLIYLWVFWQPQLDPKGKTAIAILFALWVTAPPVWFLYEWSRFKYSTKEALEDFKYGQQLARNIWLAVAALIGLLIGVKV